MTKDKGAMHINLVNYEWVFWEETVLTDGEGNVTASDSSTAGEEDGVGASNEDRLDLTTYVMTISGESKQLELELDEGEAAPAVVWTSDNPDVARVDDTGLVTPVSTGYTIITVSLQSDPSVYGEMRGLCRRTRRGKLGVLTRRYGIHSLNGPEVGMLCR